MNITLEQAKEIAAGGEYKVIPISCEILSDFITPIELMRKLKKASTHCYMLESAQANEKWGRYTFLGYDPKMEITCMDGELSIGDKKIQTKEPWVYLKQIMADYKSPRFDDLPPSQAALWDIFPMTISAMLSQVPRETLMIQMPSRISTSCSLTRLLHLIMSDRK